MTRCPIVHFDHHSQEHAKDPWRVFAELRQSTPVAYTPVYAGFWVLSTYECVRAVALDDATFSSASDIIIPSNPYVSLIPIHVDPPKLQEYRRLLNPFFAVKASRALEPKIREFTTSCIDAFSDAGECDLVRELASPVPAMTTIHLVGLPHHNWQRYAEVVHAHTFSKAGSEAHSAAKEELLALRAELADYAAQRRADPQTDMISHLATATLDGELLPLEEVTSMLFLVVIAGLDTTTAALGNALLYLDHDRELRDRLIDRPDLIPNTVEELLRYEAPVPGFARTVTRACTIGETAIEAGEKVFMLWASANRDEAVFPEPDQVDIEREPNRHLTFGVGQHHCLGATIARVELKVVLEEVLRRIPDYRIDHASVIDPETIGIVYGKVAIPARFQPRPRKESDNGARSRDQR